MTKEKRRGEYSLVFILLLMARIYISSKSYNKLSKYNMTEFYNNLLIRQNQRNLQKKLNNEIARYVKRPRCLFPNCWRRSYCLAVTGKCRAKAHAYKLDST